MKRESRSRRTSFRPKSDRAGENNYPKEPALVREQSVPERYRFREMSTRENQPIEKGEIPSVQNQYRGIQSQLEARKSNW